MIARAMPAENRRAGLLVIVSAAAFVLAVLSPIVSCALAGAAVTAVVGASVLAAFAAASVVNGVLARVAVATAVVSVVGGIGLLAVVVAGWGAHCPVSG